MSVDHELAGEELPNHGRTFRDRFFLNASSNLAGTLVTLAVWFFLTPMLAHHFGVEDYGLWVLAMAAVTYGAFLDLGTRAAVTKYLAEYRARGDVRQSREVVGTALIVSASVGLSVIVVGVVLAMTVPALFDLGPEQADQTAWLIGVTGVWVAVTLPASMLLAVLRGLQRFDLINIVSAAAMVAYAGVVVAILAGGGGVVAVAAAAASLELVVQIAMIAMIRHGAPDLGLPWFVVSRRAARSILSFGSVQSVTQIGSQVRGRSDEILVGILLPLAHVGPYSIARRFSELPSIVSSQLEVVAPASSELDAVHDHVRLRTVLTTTTRIGLASTVVLAMLVAILGPSFLRLWVGPEFATGASLLVIFVASTVCSAVFWPTQWMLIGMKRQRRPAIAAASSAVIKVGLAVALAHAFGVEGIAASTLIATFVAAMIILPHGFRVAGVSLVEAVRDVAIPALAPLIPATLLALGLRSVIEPDSYHAILGIALASGASYVALYLVIPATAAERALAQALPSHASRRIMATRPASTRRTRELE